MGLVNPTLPTLGQLNATEDADIVNAFTAIIAEINGNLSDANLAAALLDKLGVSGGGVIRRGRSVIAGEGTRTNVAYGALDGGAAPGPDRVQGVVLPTDGLIVVGYYALWKESVLDKARAGIFLNSVQQKVADESYFNAVEVHACTGDVSTPDRYAPLVTTPIGLAGSLPTNIDHPSPVTTGQALAFSAAPPGMQFRLNGDVDGFGGARTSDTRIHGGPCYIFAAAGTYDVSVQFRSSSGSVTVKDRKLWVWTIGF